jgi:RHS repeat-associated protein
MTSQTNAHGATVEGTHDTGVVPSVNTWYRFIVEVEDVSGSTAIRVKVWEDNTSEPANWQIDAVDSSSPLTSGTFGLWAYSNGSKYWDELAVESLTAVPANTPTATNTAVTSTPTATSDPSGTAVIQRSTYMIAGTAVALRLVEKDANETELSNTLYYYHTDHLGSNSAMSYGSDDPTTTNVNELGMLVGSSTARYTPFGAYRTIPTTDLTDRGFTGHKENRSLGLTYMNARYFVVGLSRFASADSIIPNPASPQSFNRYSYVLNSPLILLDPTGHFEEEAIYDYILNSECGGSFNCADQMVDDWMADGAWWLMLMAASADDILYGMNWDGPGSFKFIGSGMNQLQGIVTHGGLGVTIRLSELYAGSYTIPHIIDGSGQIAHNIPSWSYSADWEALQFHKTGQVLFREDFSAAASIVAEVYGSSSWG